MDRRTPLARTVGAAHYIEAAGVWRVSHGQWDTTLPLGFLSRPFLDIITLQPNPKLAKSSIDAIYRATGTVQYQYLYSSARVRGYRRIYITCT